MPTARPRHMITETDDIAAAIDRAAELWPDIADERAELLRRLIVAMPTDADARAAARRAERLHAIRDNAGGFEGLWPEGWLRDERDEWPQ